MNNFSAITESLILGLGLYWGCQVLGTNIKEGLIEAARLRAASPSTPAPAVENENPSP